MFSHFVKKKSHDNHAADRIAENMLSKVTFFRVNVAPIISDFTQKVYICAHACIIIPFI